SAAQSELPSALPPLEPPALGPTSAKICLVVPGTPLMRLGFGLFSGGACSGGLLSGGLLSGGVDSGGLLSGGLLSGGLFSEGSGGFGWSTGFSSGRSTDGVLGASIGCLKPLPT